MNTGIFGGSFNPSHKGHRIALDAFIKEAKLDCVYIIPSFLSPHKETPENSASFEDRMEMCRLAFSGADCRVIFSDIEREIFDITGKKSYTVNTLERLNLDSPYLFVGSDMFFTLDSWYNSDYLFKNTTIVAMSRDDDRDKILEFKEKYQKEQDAKILIINEPHLKVSSTELRGNISSDLIIPEVKEYIEKRGLYKKKKSREELISLLKEKLSEKRFNHTLSVEKEALFLADIFCPEFKEEISRGALLHDVTKYFTLDEHLKLKNNLSQEDLNSPETLHALTGSAYARDVLLESLAVSSMIEKHTTASERMTLFDMIIFVSDYIEETRTHLNCIKERERLRSDLKNASRSEQYYILKDCVIRILENTVEYLENKKSYIHPCTLNAITALRGQNEEKSKTPSKAGY